MSADDDRSGTVFGDFLDERPDEAELAWDVDDEPCEHECTEDCYTEFDEHDCRHQHCFNCGDCTCAGYCDDYQTYNLRPAETGGAGS